MGFARGTVQDVQNYAQDEFEGDSEVVSFGDQIVGQPHEVSKTKEWRLTAEDHLKSLLFIEKLRGDSIDKDRLGALETEITAFKSRLANHHGI